MKLAILASLAMSFVSIGVQAREYYLRTRGKLSSRDKAVLSFLGESSFGRNEVIDLIVNEYTAKTSDTRPSRDERDWVETAIEAMEISENDGRPIQVKGRDFLYVGSVGASRNEDFLRRHNITHVINWSTSARCNLFSDIEYLCAGVRGRKGMVHHIDELDEAVEFVEAARKSGGKVLSHCWNGKNRSVTHLIAYLMKYEGMSAAEANHLIKETRPKAKPYWDTLDEYSEHYLNKS